jgi:diguanylate cyclase (GGDEF)-like protein
MRLWLRAARYASASAGEVTGGRERVTVSLRMMCGARFGRRLAWRARWLMPLAISLSWAALAQPAKAPVAAVAQVRSLLAQAKSFEERDPKRVLSLAQRANGIARGLGDPALLRQAQNALCNATAAVDAQAALPIAEDGLLASRRAADTRASAGFLSCKGYALELQGKPGEAAIEFEGAVATAEKAGDKELLADALALRGGSRHYHGRYDDAIADLNRAYALNVEIGAKSGQRYTLNAIANVYSDENVGEYDKAIGYYRQLLKENEAAGLDSEVATSLFNIAAAREMKGELDAALQEYRRALEIDTGLGDRASIAEGELSIGSLLTKQGNATEALPWIERALERFAAAGDAESIARARAIRAKALRAAGRIREAIVDLEFAERHFRAQNNPRYLVKVYETLADAHAAAGNWRTAYQTSLAYRAAQDQLQKRAREEQTSRLRVQFDTAKKEQENRALLIENAHRGEALRNAERVRSLQRLFILLGTAFLALLAAMALQQLNKGRRLRLLAMTDELTGLPNRRSILEFLEGELRAARWGNERLSVVAFDVDHFKRINDLHGHHSGDRVLRAMADIVSGQLPIGARVGRMGGEEFLVVLPGTVAARAREAAESLRMALSCANFESFGDDERVTISLGVAEAGRDDDVEVLLKRADSAMYRAKGEGRDRTVCG